MKQNLRSDLSSVKRLRVKAYAIAASVVLLFTSTSKIAAQTPPITSSGFNTTVTQNGSTYNITGGSRPGGGANLFHSFGDFNVPNNNIANFQNDSGLPTSNILGRVTSGNISNIFGTIQTVGFSNANLFLMNPNGFLFGANATLNVGGTVTFTSGDYLRLADGVRFNVIPNPSADALLSPAPVAAFGFLGSNPGAITVQGSHLAVAAGTGISLVGGNITIQSGTLGGGTPQPAQLIAPNGRIQLASTASPGEFDAVNLQALSNVNGATLSSFGSVSLAPGSTMDTSHSGNGKVSIRGGEFILDLTNAVLTTAPSALPATGDDVISLAGGSLIQSRTMSGTDGAAINIVTDLLEVKGASQILSSNEGPGGIGGDINISATKAVKVSGYDEATSSGVRTDFGIVTSGVFAGTIGDGTGGAISITTPKMTIEESAEVATLTAGAGNGKALTLEVGTVDVNSGGRLSTISGWNYLIADHGDGLGQAGSINIQGAGTITISGTGPFNNYSRIQGVGYGLLGGGSAPIEITAPSASVSLEHGGRIETMPGFGANSTGDITLTIKNLIITNGSINTVGGDGRSGNILVTASDSVSLSGEVMGQPSPITSENGGSGGTGIVQVETDNLSLSNRARILNSTFLDPAPSTAAKILVNATKSITMADSSDIRVSSFLSDVGGLEISSPTILLSGQSTMNTIGQGTGNSGPITINALNLSLLGGSRLNSSILSGSSGVGGPITIQGLGSPAESVVIDGTGSGIFSETKGPGQGGSIFVNANSVTLQNGAHISSRSTGPGNAGNIKIDAGRELMVRNSGITTEAKSASGGNIDVIAIDRIHLANGRISTSVLGGAGDSGRITIDPIEVVVQDNSAILTQAVRGRGGDITISASRFLQDPTSLVDASSQFGQSGRVSIQSPTSNLSGTVKQLPSKPSDTQALLHNRCAALAGGKQSTFIVAGRDALPSQPGGWLSSPVSMDHFTGEGPEHAANPSAIARVTETEIVSLRRLTPPGFLVRTFAIGSTGCHS